GLLERELDGERREAIIVFDAREALLLTRGDHDTVVHERGGAVVVVERKTEDVHFSSSLGALGGESSGGLDPSRQRYPTSVPRTRHNPASGRVPMTREARVRALSLPGPWLGGLSAGPLRTIEEARLR